MGARIGRCVAGIGGVSRDESRAAMARVTAVAEVHKQHPADRSGVDEGSCRNDAGEDEPDSDRSGREDGDEP